MSQKRTAPPRRGSKLGVPEGANQQTRQGYHTDEQGRLRYTDEIGFVWHVAADGTLHDEQAWEGFVVTAYKVRP